MTYGCIKWPPGCDLLKCKILIRFLKTSNAKQISMEITGFVDGWIAFGFSDRPRVMVKCSTSKYKLLSVKFVLSCFMLTSSSTLYQASMHRF